MTALLIFLGFACVAFAWFALYFANRLQYWRLQWIELEHRLAVAENRKPRNIRDCEKEPLI